MGIFDNYDDSIGGTINKTPTTPKVDTKPKSGSIFANFDSQIGSTVQPTTTPQVTPTIPTTPIVTIPKKNIFQKYADWTEKTGKAIGNWEKAKVLNFVESAKEKLATVRLYDYSKEYDVTKDTVKPTIEELKAQNATIGYPKHNLIDPFMAGIGDVEQVTGSTMLWLNRKLEASDSKLKGLKQITSGVGTALQQEGEEMKGKYTDIKAQQDLGEFDWGDMLNPSWYHQNVLRAVPFSLALVPASLAAGSVGSMAGLGAFGTFIVSSILGGTTSRGLESATEAGTVYDELRKKGLSHEEADKQANEVFKKNMSLAGLDIGEFALTFMPGGKKIKSFLPKGVLGATRVAFTGAMGGTEELLQKKFQDEAEGKTFSWKDPETKASAIIGTIMGGGLTTGALVVEGFKTKVLDNLPPNMKGNGKTDDDNLEAIAQQYPEETKKAINEAVKETAKEEDEKIEAMTKIVEDVEEGLKTQSVAEVAQDLRDAGFNMKAINTIISTVTSEDPTDPKEIDSATIIQQSLEDNELDSTLADMKSKQALNEAGSTLEETKTGEADNTTPGAVKPKGATETHIRVGTEGETTIQGNEVTKDNAKVSYKTIDSLGTGQQPITTIKKTLIDNGVSEIDAESIISKTPVVEGMTYTDNVFDAITEHNNGVKSISEAQGEVELKIKPSKESSGEEVLEYAQNLGGETIYSNAKEAIKSQNFKLETVDISEILKNDPDAKEYVDANKNRYGKQKQGVDNPIIIGNWQGKSDSVIDGYNRLLTKVQQGETTIEAYKAQGEAKMKIKDSMTDEQRDEVSKLLDGLDTTPLTVNGKPDLEDTELYFRLDQLKTKNEKGKLTNEEYIEAKGLLEEAKLGLDTLKTKIDNKEYGFHRNTTNEGGIEKGVQPNKGRVLRSGIGSEGIDSMGQKYPNFDFTKIQGSPNYANILIPRGSKESEIRDVLDWLIPDAQPEVVDAFIEFNSKLEYPIEVNRVDEVDGNPGFFAGIRPLVKGKYQFYLKSSSMSTITKEHIYHELPGHAGFESIGEEGRKIRTEAIKKQYELTPEKFKTFIKKDAKAYWEMTVDNIVSYLQNKNGGGLDNQTLIEILQEAGLMDENNKTIFPEDIMEATFNFDEINQKLNKSLKDRGYETSNKTEAHNFLMIDEINSYLIENSESFKDSTIEEINKVTNSVLDGTFKFGKIEVNLKVKSEPGPEFGGVTFKLKDSTKLTSEDIIKKHANIQLKRDIVITDVYGDKAVLKAGEGITPYEVTGNKFILQDGEAYLVSKSQAQNVINNSKTGEAKPFAPELKQTEETASPLNKSIGSSDFTTWQLPGGTDYQEIIIQAPSNKFSIDDLNFKERVLGEWKASSNGLDYGIIKEGEKFYVYRDGGILGRVVNTFNQAQQVAVDNLQGEIDKSSFISSHWPRIKNPISHIRINKRTYNGKKVAFMEELQSDWAREGRDKGFSKEITKETAKEQGFTVEKSKSTTGAEAYFIDNTTDEFFYRKGFENTGFDTEAEAWDSVIKRLKETTGAVPNNPLLKNWQELSIKRALQEAVNSNAKYFAWINGPQTAARYNLSKQVENIEWTPFNDGKRIKIDPIGGNYIEVFVDENGNIKDNIIGRNMPNEWKGKNIADAIGKGISEKIMQEKSGSLKGDGLNVGGAWAGNLYDRQVRTIVENLTGQKVEMLDMGLAIDTRATKWRITKQKGFEMFADTDIILDESNIQVGDTVTNLGSRIEDVKDTDKYVVTDILGNNKFKAVPKKVWDNLKSKDVVMVNGLADNISTKIGKENFYKRWGKLPERYFKEEFEKTQQTFDISQKTTQQMGIEITPEVKVIINGEAPQVKVSGKLPFTEQITAPVMFKIKLPEEKSLISLHNISIPSLSFAQRLGGVLINPSMAVIDINKQGFDNYGEISLIGDTDLLSQGKTFASDIYSPRFPSLTIKIPKTGYDILNKTFKKYEDIVDEKLYSLDTEEFDRSMSNSSLAMYDFLTKEGIEVPKTKQSGASHYDIKNGMRDIIQEKNLTSEFNNYIDRMKTNIGATSHIFKGYTYSGTRRYVPATVENISKDMRARGLANKEGMDYGLGSFRAKLVQKLPTIKKISDAKDRIVTTEEFEKTREEMNTRYSNLIEEYAKKLKPGTGSSNPFINFDEVSQGLSDYVTGQFPEFLNRFTNVPQSLKDKTQEFIKEVKEMPTEYFESKFTRPVRLSEFKYAVIPDNTTEDIIRNLKNDGLEVIKYKKGDETDRLNKIKELKQNETPIQSPVFFKIKLPEVNTGNRAEDAKQILAHVEKKLGVSSIVNSIKEKETAITIAKDVLADSPESNLEKYVADAGDFKGTLPEVTGKPIAELKKNKAFRGVKNEKTFEFAKNGDSIVKSIFSDYGIDVDSEEGRARFEKYKDTKNRIVKQEKEIKVQKDLFKKTDTFELLDSDKKLLSEIVYTKNSAPEIRELIEQVREEKAIRRKEVLEHKARPLMKYVSKKTGKLSKNFTEKSVQILDDLKFKDVDEANKAIEDYMMKMKEFVNPISRLAMDERNAKFLRDKVKIMEAVEKKMKEEGRDRKQKIEAIRDFFYMTDSEIKGVIGTRDYRLMSDKEFNDFTKKLQEESIKIAEHQMAVAEVEWTIAQKQLQKTDNFLQAMKLPTDINKLTTEQLGKLNELFNMFENEDIFLGKREIETLTKNTEFKDIKTYRQMIEQIFPGVPVETLKAMKIDWTNYVESASSLSQDNPLLNWLIMEFRRVSIIKNQSITKVRNEINELAKKARESRKRSWIQKLIPTDELVWDYINERDLELKTRIAQTMTKSELEFAHYMANGPVGWDKKRDYLLEKDVLEHYFKDETYITHLRRGFLEAWLRGDSKGNFFSVFPRFISAIGETVFNQFKLEEKTLNILNERTSEILPLEKYFPYKERRSGTLVPTKNMARVFIQYHTTFEMKRMLDSFMPPAISLAHAVSPSERTEAGLEMDTSIMEFFREFINTQKGRPMSFGKILTPGNSLDIAIRAGISLVRYKFLAYNLVSQITTPVGEQYATYIQSGLRKYALGIKRSKFSKQGNIIAKKYEAIIGEPLFDKLINQSIDIGSKIGETAFMGFSIASRQANKIYLLGQLTKEEFASGEISDKRLAEIENNMYKWRAGDPVTGIASKTSVGSAVRQFRSWAIPIVAQSTKNVKKMIEITKKDGFKEAGKSKEFGELFRATVPVLIFMLIMYNMYKELGDKDDKSFSEKVIYKAMTEVSSTLSALAPATFLSIAPLQGVLLNLMTSLGQITVGLATGDRTSEGEVPGLSLLKKTVTPALIKGVLDKTKEEEALAKVSKSSYTAKGELEDINKELVTEAKNVWEQVKVLGQETKEAKDLLNKTYPQTKEGDTNYKIYQKAKQADMDYWKDVTEKVIPIVKQASVYGFKSDETKELTNKKNMTDDEFTVYEKIKDVLYPTSESGEQDEWDKQSFIEHVSNIAKGWTSDPIDALNKIIRGGDWKITEVTNGQIIVNRMPQSATDAMKAEVGKLNTGYKADHIWPVQGGGGSDKNNINIITTEQWKQNTPLEVYLIKQLKAGNITGDQLKEYAVRFKIGRGQVTSGPLFEKYKTPITFEEIKQEIAK